MRYVESYAHHSGDVEWQRRDLRDWLFDVFEAPSVRVETGNTGLIRDHVRTEITKAGWAGETKLAPSYDVTVFSVKGDLAIQLQTGNVARAFYDLLKLQYLFSTKKVEAAALAVPTQIAAALLGSNVAHYERIGSELQLFDRVITVPVLLIAFE